MKERVMADKAGVRERVVKVVASVLKLDLSEINDESNFVFDLGADSMASISLVSAFEKEFDLEMDEESSLEVQTVGGAVDHIMGCLD